MEGTSQNFELEVLGSDIPVVVDFWAPWCGPCRAVGPVLEELGKEYDGRVKVVKVNVDEQPDLAQAFSVRSIPTIVALHDGEIIDVQVGAGGRGHLEKLFETASSRQPVAEIA